MPALMLFGRRWHVGTDDFVISSFVDLLIRLAWLVAAVAVFWKNEHHLHASCDADNYIKIFYYGVFILSHLIIIVDILLLQNSRKGSIILDADQRRYVPFILYMRFGVELAEITWNVLGTIALYQNKFHCHTAEEPTELIEILLIFNWTILTIQLIYFFYMFDPIGRSRRQFDELTDSNPNFKHFMPLAKTKYTKKWLRKCRCILCSWCCIHDNSVLDAYREISKLFGTMFADDLITSDYMAAFVLVGLKHKENMNRLREIEVEKHRRSQVSPVITEQISPTGLEKGVDSKEVVLREILSLKREPEDWKSVRRVENYVRFAVAAYGIIHPMLTQKYGACRLVKNCSCCTCLPGKAKPADVDGDSCCLLCFSGVKTTLSNIPVDDIVYASFKDTAFRKPFFVALDHKTESIVIACRGTLSTKDLMTDMTGWPAHIPGYPETFKAHHGMLLTSLELRDKLNKMQILERLLRKYPNYQIVLTGQSLGAGVATITSLLLRLQYPQVKCYVFSTPGGLLTYCAAEYCKDFLVAVIYGDDFISRLGILQIERLKVELVTAMKECKTPKYRILLGGYCCCVPSPKLEYISSSTESMNEDSQLGSTSSLRDDGDISQHTQDTSVPMTPTTPTNNNDQMGCSTVCSIMKPQPISTTRFPQIEGMYPPGNLFYITKIPKESRTPGEPKWRWRWAERHEFDDIIICSRMFTDHIPVTMPRALHKLAYPYEDV